MHDVSAYSSAIWPPLAAALFVAALGLYTWRRRDVPAGKPFLAASAFGSLLLLSIACETAAAIPAVKISWYQWQYGVQMLAVTAGTCIALEYTYPGRWLTRRNLALLALPPLLTITTIIFASQLIWQKLWVEPNGTVVAVYTPFGVLPAAYSWGLLFVNAAAFLWLFVHSPQHRWPVAIMLGGQITGRALILLDITGVQRVMGIDLTVVVVLAPWAAYATALLFFHILDPLPAAQLMALAQMSEGMIVLDAGKIVASVNPAAAAMLDIPLGRARGRRLEELLPASVALGPWRDAGQAGKTPEPLEINFSSGAGEHWYAVELAPLSDFRGQLVGYLLMLRDVTEQKRAHAQFLEQERALATLRERERLARELHDGVTQLLAAAHLQVNTAKLLFIRGQGAQLQACLDTLAATTLEAEADLREYLLGVKTTTAGAKPLFAALREYLAQYTRLYGIPVELAVPVELEEEGLPAIVEVQLVRIIQEALTNVRKHACIPQVAGSLLPGGVSAPCRASVTFALAGPQASVVIADNGCGFDPAAGARTGSRYGLRSMEERAEAIGGSLAVTSSPGTGTKVTVVVPRTGGSWTAGTAVRMNDAQAAGAGIGVTR
ncbi:MAG: histidine kinase N-terminal 7TM domain-containing protein [Caldilineaceae bacterium]